MKRKWKNLKELIPQVSNLYEFVTAAGVAKALLFAISAQECALYITVALLGFASRLSKHLQPRVEVQEKIVEYRMDPESTEKLVEFERKLGLLAMKSNMKF